jgi:hypothetical protein
MTHRPYALIDWLRVNFGWTLDDWGEDEIQF